VNVRSPIDVDQSTTLTGPTRGVASVLGRKRLKFNRDKQSRGLGEAEVGGGVCGWKVYGGAEVVVGGLRKKNMKIYTAIAARSCRRQLASVRYVVRSAGATLGHLHAIAPI
jgi:hypothetical protein